jgi:serine/threonine protein kinase
VDRQKTLESKGIMTLVRQLLEGLTYLHEKGIYHGDIKPQNILYDGDENRILYIDFGNSSIEFSKAFPKTTLTYSSPEQLTKTRFSAEKCDIWALGCTIVELILKRRLFDGTDESTVKKQITLALHDNGSSLAALLEEQLDGSGSNLVSVIRMMMSIDTGKRPTAKELLVMVSGKEPRIAREVSDVVILSPDQVIVVEVSKKFFVGLAIHLCKLTWLATALELIQRYLYFYDKHTGFDLALAAAIANISLKYHYNIYITTEDFDQLCGKSIKHHAIMSYERHVLRSTGTRIEFNSKMEKILHRVENQSVKFTKGLIYKMLIGSNPKREISEY